MLFISPFITVYCCVVAAIFGACMGSFLNCMAWRIVNGESVLKGRSHCDICGHILGVKDLFPILSFVFSKGKCRYCGSELSRRHFYGEIVSAIVFVSLLLKYDISLQTLEGWIFAGILLGASFADLEGYIIPDRFIAAGIVLFIGSLFFSEMPLQRFIDGALGGFSVALALLFVVHLMEKRLGKEAMGGGDIKLLFITGLFFGFKKNIFCLILSCLIGIVFGLIELKKNKGENSAFPWGPSIALAAYFTALIGNEVVGWYMGFLL